MWKCNACGNPVEYTELNRNTAQIDENGRLVPGTEYSQFMTCLYACSGCDCTASTIHTLKKVATWNKSK